MKGDRVLIIEADAELAGVIARVQGEQYTVDLDIGGRRRALTTELREVSTISEGLRNTRA